METIEFRASVGDDQVIRPPAGVTLPHGAIDVVVRPVEEDKSDQRDASLSPRAWLLELAAEAERLGLDLPPDMAEHHDHYAHGKPYRPATARSC